MSTTRKFLRGAALSGLSTGVALVSLLLVAKMVTNALEPHAVAIFLLTLLLADGFNLMSNFGLFASAPKLIAEPPDKSARDRLLAAMLGGQLLPSTIVVIILPLCALAAPAFAPMLHADPGAMQLALFWSAPLCLLGAYRDTLLAALAGYNRYGAHMAASVVLSAGQALSVFFLVWMGQATIGRALLAVTLAQATGVGMLLLFVQGGFRFPFSFTKYLAAVRFTFPLYLNTLLNFVFQRLDTLMVTSLLGLHATAVYEIAKRFPQLLSRVLNALLLPWLPTVTGLIAQQRDADAARALTKVLLSLTTLGYVAIFGAWVFRTPLVLLLSSPEYAEAAPLLGWLMLGIHFAVQAGVFGQTLIALGRPAAVTIGNMVQAACSLGGAGLLLPRLGLAGMGYAWCIGAGLSLLIQAGMVWRLGLRAWVPGYLGLQCCLACALGVIIAIFHGP